MHVKHVRKVIVSEVIFLLVSIFIGSFLYNSFQERQIPSDNNITFREFESATQSSVEIIKVPQGWKVYRIEKVSTNLSGITFAYPPNWKIEVFSNELHLYGDGYRIKVKGDSGFPTDMKLVPPTYTVGGFPVKIWQREVNNRYEQVIKILDTEGIVFWVDTPEKTTEISDKILSTVSFLK